MLESQKKAIREKREAMNKKYSVNFKTIGYKFNRDEANEYNNRIAIIHN